MHLNLLIVIAISGFLKRLFHRPTKK